MADDTTQEPSSKTIGAALGEICWLLSQSQGHRHNLFLADLEWMVIPPVTLGQYRLFYSESRPVGLALWAYITDAVAARLSAGGRLGTADWRDGERLFLVELVAPFGGQEQMFTDLCDTVFAGKRFQYVRTHPDGRRETVETSGDQPTHAVG